MQYCAVLGGAYYPKTGWQDERGEGFITCQEEGGSKRLVSSYYGVGGHNGLLWALAGQAPRSIQLKPFLPQAVY